MELTEHSLRELSDLQVRFFTTPLRRVEGAEALIVAFEGKYGYGSGGNRDALFMELMAKAALGICWRSRALIFDLRAMSYEWGDAIGQPLAGPLGINVARAIVCSGL